MVRLFFDERKAFRRTVVRGGYRYTVGYALGGTVEKAGRIAAYGGVDGVVRFGKFRGCLGVYIARRFGRFVCRAAGVACDGNVFCAAAVSVIELAIFLSAFKIVHGMNLLESNTWVIITARTVHYSAMP